MGPGQIPRENIVWLDSTLKTIPDDMPIIFMNHYPQDSALKITGMTLLTDSNKKTYN
jgi:hypothetical protein